VGRPLARGNLQGCSIQTAISASSNRCAVVPPRKERLPYVFNSGAFGELSRHDDGESEEQCFVASAGCVVPDQVFDLSLGLKSDLKRGGKLLGREDVATIQAVAVPRLLPDTQVR